MYSKGSTMLQLVSGQPVWHRCTNLLSVSLSRDFPDFYPFLLVLIFVNCLHLCFNQLAQLSLCAPLFVSQILIMTPHEPSFQSSGSLSVCALGDFWPPSLAVPENLSEIALKSGLKQKSLCW